MNIKETIALSLHNFRSFHTPRKLIVFQSDDWGAIRTPSQAVFDGLVKKGIPLYRDVYSCNDALEANEDLERLFDVLYSVKDTFGNPAKFTANYVVANPDFDRIKQNGFIKYFWESINESYTKYNGENPLINICPQGIDNSVWVPQSHGREHLNVALWMKCLKDGIPEIRIAFDHGMFALTKSLIPTLPVSFMEAFNSRSLEEEKEHANIVTEGLELFRNLFGYNSKSFISPNYVWSPTIENCLHAKGVMYIQSGRVQHLPFSIGSKYVKHYCGARNYNGQLYLTRNCNFEPTTSRHVADVVDKCLSEISLAFSLHTPAVINTHRINYIGRINPKNSSKNLNSLKILLANIVAKWPNVEFIDSVELGDLIK